MIHQRVLIAAIAAFGVFTVPNRATQPVASYTEAAELLAHDLSRDLETHRIGTVAVMPFLDHTGNPIRLGAQLRMAIENAIVDAGGSVRVVESGRSNELVEELQRGRSPGYDTTFYPTLGKLLPRQAKISGMLDTSDDPIRIRAKLTIFETGANIGAASIDLPRANVAEALLYRDVGARYHNSADRRSPESVLPRDAVTVLDFLPYRDRRDALVILHVENPLDQSIEIAFAKGDFGRCEVELLSASRDDYRLVDENREGQPSVGSGGLACAKVKDGRSAYTRLDPGERARFPLLFRANTGREMSGGPYSLRGQLVQFRAERPRQSIDLWFRGLEGSSP